MNRTKVMIIIVIILALLAGGLYFWNQRNQEAATDETDIEVTLEPSNTPTPSEVDPDEYSIEILNGSGVAGEAGRAQSLLEDGEYDVISTGNADSYDYEETVIQAGSSVDELWLEALRDILGDEYTVQRSVEDLDTESEADVVIIIGSLDENGDSLGTSVVDDNPAPTVSDDDEDETPTPSPSPTESA